MTLTPEGGLLRVTLGGRWALASAHRRWHPPAQRPESVQVSLEGIGEWDSSLALFILRIGDWCRDHRIPCDIGGLPAELQSLIEQLQRAERVTPKDRSHDPFTAVGIATQETIAEVSGISHFVGECVLSMMRLARKPAAFRWKDCLAEMQECGAMALPIVGLVSFLVGVTMAYTGAVILRLFGGDIWVADLVGLSVTREMGAVMTAVVLAGRTGAAYAAHIGNMKANEEIDALATLGVSPVDFLVIPRMLALCVMTPLLALYANCLGILGGMLIALGILGIPPTAYWIEMLSIVDLSDITTGLIKASTFGLIVGMSGCLRGLQAERSAAGVGKAATSAVVTAIILMVIADSLYAVIFNILGW